MTHQVQHSTAPSAKVVEMIEHFIASPTVSRDSNLGLIEWTRDHLRHLGVESRLIYTRSGKPANLFATLGEGRNGGVILSGHTDVVPVDGQDWSSDPFGAMLRDGRIYGRGSADMKSFVATALVLAPEFLARGTEAAPIHFAFSYDEEAGCIGVRSLIADLDEQGIRPGGCIVDEPTEMRPVIAPKDTHRFRCSVRGKEAHSSYTMSVNAIEYAAQLIARIRQIAQRMATEKTKDHHFTVPYTTLHPASPDIDG